MTQRTSNRQAKITEEHIAEAKRLRALWDRRRQALRDAGEPVFSQEAFGAANDIGNQSAVGFFLNADTPLSFKAASGFARGLGCKIADFSPRLAALGEVQPYSAGDDADLDAMVATYKSLTPELRAKAQAFVAGLAAAMLPAKPSPSLLAEAKKETRKGPAFPTVPPSEPRQSRTPTSKRSGRLPTATDQKEP